MNIFALIKTAYTTFSKNKFRTFLTMLGIIIGVAAVIVMQAIGSGTEVDINSKIASLGTNLITISPNAKKENGVNLDAGTQKSLQMKDIEYIQFYCPSVKYISPVTSTRDQVKFASNNCRTSIMGVSPDYLKIRDITLSQGTAFDLHDMKNNAKFCIIGKTVYDNLFTKKENALGKTIRIGSIPFKIIGVIKSKGQSGFGQDMDDIILAPYTSVKNRITGSEYLQQIFISAEKAEDINKTVKEISNILKFYHKLPGEAEDDFRINTQAEITETAKSITGALTLLLASIAAISLLVGGIGIMNIMLVSVTERTREIGIRLAIGATPFDILIQLLVESVMISVTAGLFGVLFGLGISTLISNLVGWATVIKPSTEIMAFLICTLIGVFFGWYPARKAARLNPIEALRYE